jgi:hypothetical protein
MNQEEARQTTTEPRSAASGPQHLSRRDVERLRTFKLRYALEAFGFTPSQAERLLFAQWLYRRGALCS